MKRNIILLILLFIINGFWLYGISYTNQYIAKNDLIIILGEKVIEVKPEEKPSDEEEIVEYEGESFSNIGRKIESFLVNTTLEGQGEYIAKVSVNKGVNPYLIGAMVLVNSNCPIQCNAIVNHCNNVGDLEGTSGGCFGGTYKKYPTLEDSISDLVNYVLINYYANDLKTPNAIYRKYGKNSAWSHKVTRYMEKIKKVK